MHSGAPRVRVRIRSPARGCRAEAAFPGRRCARPGRPWPQSLRDRPRDERGIAQRGQAHPEDAGLVFGHQLCGSFDREARLARAARPGECHETSAVLEARKRPLELVVSADERARRRGRFVLEIVFSGGKETSPSWKIGTASAMSFRRCSPRSAGPARRGLARRAREERPGRRGWLRRCAHPGGRRRRYSPPYRCAASRCGGPCGRWIGPEASACPSFAAASAPARRQGIEERVTLRVDFDAAVAREGIAINRVDARPALGVGLGAELVEQLRRALDVGEEEGDGAGGKVVTHRRQSCAKSNA